MFNTAVDDFLIIVQYPIPDDEHMTVSPLADEIPTPDGEMEFVITMLTYHESPTDVYCDYDFTDSTRNKRSASLVYGTNKSVQYTFYQSGTKHVTFNCTNMVSSMFKTSTIIVRSFVLSDFVIFHKPRIGMNMTVTSVGDELVAHHTPTQVEFTMSLFNCTKLPPDIKFTWNFGDGNSETRDLDMYYFKHHHIYENKGTYALNIRIVNYDTYDTYDIPTQYLSMGLISFYVSQLVGFIDLTTFEYNATGLDRPGEYIFDFGDGYKQTVNNVKDATASHIYLVWGTYIMSVTAQNETFSETVYYDLTVTVDYNLASTSVYFSNQTVFVPPGDVTLTVTIPEQARPRPFMKCIVDFDDIIIKETQTKTKNISFIDPMVMEFQYLALGYVHPIVRCENNAEQWNYTETLLIWNKCFSFNGIFDRQYAYPDTPMKVYTSLDTDLASRMYVKCHWVKVIYEWTILTYNNGVEKNYNFSLPEKPTGSLTFRRGSIYPGLYKIWLQVTLVGETFYKEYTYVNFIRTSPFALIRGGSQRRLKRSEITVDGSSQSYDPEKGGSHIERLSFFFYCFR